MQISISPKNKNSKKSRKYHRIKTHKNYRQVVVSNRVILPFMRNL